MTATSNADLLSKARALEAICARLSGRDREGAAEVAREHYPFTAPAKAGRRYGFQQLLKLLLRDGFYDRYTGDPLMNPSVLRVLSAELPAAMPYHPNWKMSCTHPMYWDFAPTIDHVVPVSRGGRDDESNWVVVSMRTNARKGPWSADDLGWTLRPPSGLADWDGLTRWFLDYSARPDVALPASLHAERQTLVRALAAIREPSTIAD